MRVIKRYKNYHFYDTIDKVYISINEILELSKTVEIVVLDFTNKDITKSTITKALRWEDGIKNNNLTVQK